MKRSWPSIVAGAALAAILGLYMITYQVRFNEVAVRRTFGKIAEPDPQTLESRDVIREPGLKWKWPWPVQRVTVYDNRLQITETIGEETPTRDGKNVIVTTVVGWRIDNPYEFSRRYARLKDAEEDLKTLVRNDQKTVIGNYNFANFVSTSADELQYDVIEAAILAMVEPEAQDNYGVKVEYIGIEKLALPKRITENVFSAMQEERKAQAARYTSEGESKATEIKAEAESIAGTIMSFAERKAAQIVAVGIGRAAEHNRIFSADEELEEFLLKIDSLPAILKERTTMILKSPFDLLRVAEGAELAGPATRPAPGAGAKAGADAAGEAMPEVVDAK